MRDDLQVKYSTKHPDTGEIIESEDPAEIIGLRLGHILKSGKPRNELLFETFRKAVENLRPALDMVTMSHLTMVGNWQGDTVTPIKKTREVADLYTPIGKIAKLIEDIEELMHDAEQMKMF